VIVRWARVVALAAGVLVLALRGGSYDLVTRGEAFTLIWWVLGLGVALGALPRARAARPVAIAVVALCVFAAWTAVGFAWTPSAERTLIEVARTLGYAGILLVVAWTFDARERVPAAAVLTIAAVTVCALALISRLAPSVLTSALTETGFLPRRLSYPFEYWNALGTWAAMTFSLALAWASHAERWPWRGAALAAASLAMLVGYLTYSRTAIAVFVIAVVGVIALARNRWLAAAHGLLAAGGGITLVLTVRAHPALADGSAPDGAGALLGALAVVTAAAFAAAWATWATRLDAVRLSPRYARRTLAAGAVTLAAVSVAVGPGVAQSAWHSFDRPERRASGDLAERFVSLGGERRVLWAVALDAFAAYPIRGIGAGTFEFTWNRDGRRSERVRDAHSLYLETLAERGILGLLVLLGALGSLLVGAVAATIRQHDPQARGAATGCCAAFVVFCVAAAVDWMWEATTVATGALVAVALVCVPEDRSRSAGLRPMRRIAFTVGSLVALTSLLPGLVSATQVRESDAALRRGDFEAALSAASTAVEAQPFGASGYEQRALVLERLGKLRMAEADARHATEREPANWQPRLLLARILAERGDIPGSLRAAEEARTLNPNSPIFRAP
jgi:Flp pilus assembly protein TadD